MDEILNLIESVSEGFPSYFFIYRAFQHFRLSSISVRSTQTRLFSLRGSLIHLLSDAVTMSWSQVSVFSIFNYCFLLESEK